MLLSLLNKLFAFSWVVLFVLSISLTPQPVAGAELSALAYLKKAIEARKEGQNYKALEYLSHIDPDNPGYNVSLMEKSLNLVKVRKYDQALDALAIIENTPSASKKLKERSKNLSGRIGKLADKDTTRKHTWNGIMNMGLGYDDNAGIGSIHITMDDFFNVFFVTEKKQQKSEYVKIFAQANHYYKFDGSLDFYGRPLFAGWKSKLTAFGRFYPDTEVVANLSNVSEGGLKTLEVSEQIQKNSNNIGVVSLKTGPVFKIQDRWVSSLEFDASYINYKKLAYANFLSATWRHKYMFNKNWNAEIHASFQRRNYNKKTIYSGRRGNRYGGGITLNWEKSGYSVSPGFNMYHYDAKFVYFSFTQQSFSLSLSKKWQNGLTAYGRVFYDNYSYDNQGIDSRFQTINKKYTYNVGTTYKITDKWTLGASFYLTDNSRKDSITNYDRQRVELSVSYIF